MSPSYRSERPADHAAVEEIVAAAFGRAHGVHLLLAALRTSDVWQGLSFVATDEEATDDDSGEVIGHVAFTRAWVDEPQKLVEVLVLSPFAVRPDRQRSGVGSGLVRHALATLGSRPEPLVFLEGDPAYYSRLGFVAGSELGFIAPSVRIPPPAFQVRPLPEYDGSVSGALVYPDIWWRHDAVGLRG